MWFLCKDIRKIYGSTAINIVVHYRKGDSGWAKSNLNYYLTIKEMIQLESSTVIVVTDSPIDAQEFFLNLKNVQIVSSKCALEDFRIMLSASKLYCAPSTFSWWAAHSLEKNAEIIMPRILENSLGIYLDSNKLTII